MPVTFGLRGRNLVVERMAEAQNVSLASVEEIRFTYEQRSFAQNVFRTRLRLLNGATVTLHSVSFRSMIFSERQDAAYGAFVRELCARTARASPSATFHAGRPIVIWWLMAIVAGIVLAGLALFVAYTLAYGEYGATVIGLVVGALGIGQLIPLVRLNRPRPVDPAALPGDLVPS
ncbi:MAG: hypothetical protein EA385_15435 [Salinarimonadaceae bacterium]|nr:MAG: hypothetical protein EA385_15435 [Salinarimonadaceae bacterium]